MSAPWEGQTWVLERVGVSTCKGFRVGVFVVFRLFCSYMHCSGRNWPQVVHLAKEGAIVLMNSQQRALTVYARHPSGFAQHHI